MSSSIREKLIQNLKTIGNISHNDKLSTQTDTFTIHEPSSVRGAYRWFYSETRLLNLEKIRDLMHNTKNECTIITSADNQRIEDRHILAELISAMEHAIKGLSNMTETYKDDIATKTSIELIISETQSFLVHNQERHSLSPTSSNGSEKRYLNSN